VAGSSVIRTDKPVLTQPAMNKDLPASADARRCAAEKLAAAGRACCSFGRTGVTTAMCSTAPFSGPTCRRCSHPVRVVHGIGAGQQEECGSGEGYEIPLEKVFRQWPSPTAMAELLVSQKNGGSRALAARRRKPARVLNQWKPASR
jgi:hypothetical protein